MEDVLVGMKVLAVEDESVVTMWLEDALAELGCSVVGPAARVEEALELLEREVVHAAVLDVNLAGVSVFPVADRLQALDIPFVFATGYGNAGVIERHRERIVLQKPYSTQTLKHALEQAIRHRG